MYLKADVSVNDVTNAEPVTKREPVISAEPVCGNPPTPVKSLPSPWNEPLNPALADTAPLTNKLPVKALLPDTLNARVELPVTNNEPDMVPEPVNGKAPTPVKFDPSPS